MEDCIENMSICSTETDIEYKSDFDISTFSSELIVEFIYHHLGSSPSCRIVPNLPTNENVKIWIKLVDITLNCLKCEMKQYKSSDTKSYLHDRKSAIILVCKWSADVQILKKMYHESICDKLPDRMKTEIQSLYHHLEFIAKLMEILVKKDNKEHLFVLDNDVNFNSISHWSNIGK